MQYVVVFFLYFVKINKCLLLVQLLVTIEIKITRLITVQLLMEAQQAVSAKT